MSTVKTPINYYIQDNFLYDADEITLDRMDDGLMHHVQGYKIVTSDWEEGHGMHLIETVEIDLKSAMTMLIEDGQIRCTIEYPGFDILLFDKLVASLINKGMI